MRRRSTALPKVSRLRLILYGYSLIHNVDSPSLSYFQIYEIRTGCPQRKGNRIDCQSALFAKSSMPQAKKYPYGQSVTHSRDQKAAHVATFMEKRLNYRLKLYNSKLYSLEFCCMFWHSRPVRVRSSTSFEKYRIYKGRNIESLMDWYLGTYEIHQPSLLYNEGSARDWLQWRRGGHTSVFNIQPWLELPSVYIIHLNV